jgi:hypothetical protein
MRTLRESGSASAKYVRGVHLLALCEKCVGAAKGAAPSGGGTKDLPYVPVGPMQFLWCALDAKNNGGHERYYGIGGRLIHKKGNHYVSDVGAYKEGPLVDFTVPEPKYPQVSSVFRGVEGLEAANLRELFSSPNIAALIRDVVNDDFDSAHQQVVSNVDPTVGQLTKQLPTIVAAMLIAEPARNLRSWPINQMILDLMRNGVWKYAWSEIFWHPQDRVAGAIVDECGPVSKKDRSFIQITNPQDLHLVGGRMPASPTEGGKRGGIKLLANQAGTKLAGVQYDYIHHKEIDVVIDWLLSRPAIAALWQSAGNIANPKFVSQTDKLGNGEVFFPPSDVLDAKGAIRSMQVIREAIDAAVQGL